MLGESGAPDGKGPRIESCGPQGLEAAQKANGQEGRREAKRRPVREGECLSHKLLEGRVR